MVNNHENTGSYLRICENYFKKLHSANVCQIQTAKNSQYYNIVSLDNSTREKFLCFPRFLGSHKIKGMRKIYIPKLSAETTNIKGSENLTSLLQRKFRGHEHFWTLNILGSVSNFAQQKNRTNVRRNMSKALSSLSTHQMEASIPQGCMIKTFQTWSGLFIPSHKQRCQGIIVISLCQQDNFKCACYAIFVPLL